MHSLLELQLKGFLLLNRATCHLVLSNLFPALTKIVKQLWHGKMLKNMSLLCASGGLYCVVTAVRHIQDALMRYSTIIKVHFLKILLLRWLNNEVCLISYIQAIEHFFHVYKALCKLAEGWENLRRGKFLKKLGCRVGGEYYKIIWFCQVGW